MKNRFFLIIALIMLLSPVAGKAATSIDADYALRLFHLVDLEQSRESTSAVSSELGVLDRPELMELIELLDRELSDAYVFYWRTTKQARDQGSEADFSGWEGSFLTGVSMEERDRLTLLLGYAMEKLGDA